MNSRHLALLSDVRISDSSQFSNTSSNVQIMKQKERTLLTHLQKESCSWHWTLCHEMTQGRWSSLLLLPPSPRADTKLGM